MSAGEPEGPRAPAGRIAAGASSTRACSRSGYCAASHSAALPPNEVPHRLNRSRPSASQARTIVVAYSAMLCVRVFSAEAPKPGISKAITR